MIFPNKEKNFDLSLFLMNNANKEYIKNIRNCISLINNTIQHLSTTFYELSYDFL